MSGKHTRSEKQGQRVRKLNLESLEARMLLSGHPLLSPISGLAANSDESALYGDVQPTDAFGAVGKLQKARTVKDDFGNTFAKAAKLTLSRTSIGGIGSKLANIGTPGDVDMFRFVSPVTGWLTVTQNACSGSAIDPYVSVYDARQKLIGQNNDAEAGRNSRVDVRVVKGGVYYVQATGYGTSGKYAVGAKAVQDDYANTLAAASQLALDSSGQRAVNGKINYRGDVDMFSVVAPASGTMTVTLNSSGGKVRVDPELTLYDSSGATLAYSNNAVGTTNSAASIDVVAGQTYYIKAAGYNSTTGGYSLQVSAPVPTPSPTPTPPEPTPSPTLPSFLPGLDAYAAGAAIAGQILATGSGSVLAILGTAVADQITLSQAGSTVTLTTSAGSQDFTGSFAGIAVYGFDGMDTIRLTNSIAQSVVTVIYAGLGNDVIYEAGPDTAYLYGGDGNDSLVSVGGLADFLYGGAGLDTFWLDGADSLVDAESAETAAKSVHQITAFVQPTTDPAKAVSLEIGGQDIVDPVAGYAYTNNFVSRPLWGSGPQYNDIAQGALSDCYFLAGLSALADTDPALLQQSITALGDGTYAVRFYSGGSEVYYRIDGQLPTTGSSPAYAHLTRNGGALWAPLLEKAFAQFRRGQNSYSSIEMGWMHEAYNAISGASYASYSTGNYTADALAQTMADQLTAGHGVTAGSSSSAASPICPGHAYNVHAVTNEGGVWYVTVYNPWGVDGYSYDSNSGDGLLKLTAVDFRSRFMAVETCNA